MKRAFGIVLLVALALAGCQVGAQPTPTPSLAADYVPVVSVTGELIPARRATLSHKVGGKVVEVLVEPGDTVAVGAPLVLLDTSDLELALQRAQEQVASQQAALDLVRAGATERVIARADRDNAHQVAQAESALQAKQQQLAQAQATDPVAELDAAEARVAQVERQIVQARAQAPTSQLRLAQIAFERAQIALDDTQDEYNKALDRPWEDQAIRDTWADRLVQAKLDHRAAQAQLDQAQAAQLAHTRSLDVLEAQLEEAQAMLAQAQAAQEAHQASLDLLGIEIEAAQEQLDYVQGWENPYRDPARQEEVAQAEAALVQARVQVDEIQQQLLEATLVAPFAGTVGAVHARVGEIVSPGQSLVDIGDLATLRVETTDLDEIDVVRVFAGQQVAVTFDALPDHVFQGQVTRISPMAESGTGGVHYTTVVALEEVDPALRWGMTAFVDIEAGE
jgi:multidrug efflux pump subunit AcrA (membrane-fusion protein)